MRDSRIQSIRRRVAALQVELTTCIEELLALTEYEPFDGSPNYQQSSVGNECQANDGAPVIDEHTFTIQWNGEIVHIGCGIPFRLFAFLARHPEQFIPYDRLIEHVWHGAPRSDQTIRSQLRRVRDGLRAAGLSTLADAIKADNRHYGMLLRTDR